VIAGKVRLRRGASSGHVRKVTERVIGERVIEGKVRRAGTSGRDRAVSRQVGGRHSSGPDLHRSDRAPRQSVRVRVHPGNRGPSVGTSGSSVCPAAQQRFAGSACRIQGREVRRAHRLDVDPESCRCGLPYRRNPIRKNRDARSPLQALL
jgi:hypothetical protein